MANEFRHKDVGTDLSQAEWEAIDGHIFNSQATGDILYASSSTQLTRLGAGTQGYPLVMGASIPQWGGAITLNGTLTLGGQVFDAGSGNAEINTTGGYRGLVIESSADSVNPVLLRAFASGRTGIDGDIPFTIECKGRTDTGSEVIVGRMDFIVEDATHATFDGKMGWYTVVNRGWNTAMLLSSAGELWTDLGFDADNFYKVAGTQVVSAQGAAVADATDAADVILRLNDLLARLRTHGLIAT